MMLDNYFIANVAGTAIPGIAGYLIALYVSHKKRKKEREIEYEQIKSALVSILRNDIRKDYQDYVNKGAMTMEDKETFEQECHSYFGLGGDGFIHGIYNLAKEIPIGSDMH